MDKQLKKQQQKLAHQDKTFHDAEAQEMALKQEQINKMRVEWEEEQKKNKELKDAAALVAEELKKQQDEKDAQEKAIREQKALMKKEKHE